MGVCKYTVFSITPILTFPLAGGRDASFASLNSFKVATKSIRFISS